MNWRSTSWTISAAAKPTDFMVMALNQYGKLAPTNKAANVKGREHIHTSGDAQADDEGAV